MLFSKKLKKLSIIALSGAAIFSMFNVTPSAWTGPNWAKSFDADAIGLVLVGQVNVKPSYNDGGYHYAQGYMTFLNGEEGRVVKYTEMGRNKYDSRNLFKEYRYKDIWNLEDNPEMEWYYSSVKVPTGGAWWPISAN